MAKVVITISDNEEPDEDGGNITLTTEFQPEIREGDKGTPAQHFAFKLLHHASADSVGQPVIE